MKEIMNVIIGLVNIFEKIINTPFTIKIVFNFIVNLGISIISILSFCILIYLFTTIHLTYLYFQEFIEVDRESIIYNLKLLISNILKSVSFFL